MKPDLSGALAHIDIVDAQFIHNRQPPCDIDMGWTAGRRVCILTFMKRAPSIAPVVEKLQQEPQMAWSFTGVTAPAKQRAYISTEDQNSVCVLCEG